jgi:hypothetical protein
MGSKDRPEGRVISSSSNVFSGKYKIMKEMRGDYDGQESGE